MGIGSHPLSCECGYGMVKWPTVFSPKFMIFRTRDVTVVACQKEGDNTSARGVGEANI